MPQLTTSLPHAGYWIKHIRKVRKIKQKDLAAAVGISSTYLSLVEHNHAIPSFLLLEKICEHLKISVELTFTF